MNGYLHAATGSIILTGVLTAACYSPVALSANDQDDQQLPLPNLAQCVNTEPPMLPAKWEATALLQDFVQPILTEGKFTFDESADAFRFQLKSGSIQHADYLATKEGKLYQLNLDGPVQSCLLASHDSPFTVPDRSILPTSNSECAGNSPILGKELDWWKTKSGSVGANWFWTDPVDSSLFRSMYYTKPTQDSPIYEYFSFNYFPEFESVSDTDLPGIVKFCEANATDVDQSAAINLRDLDDMLETSSYQGLQIEAAASIQTDSWIDGLTACDSPSQLPPSWPDKVQASVVMTAVSYNNNPFPSRVYYDWTKQAQLSTLYVQHPTDSLHAKVALLTNDPNPLLQKKPGVGYGYNLDGNGSPYQCGIGVLPGPQRPDWKTNAGCKCMARLAPGSALNNSDVPVSILWCPTDLAQNQVFWTWYDDHGKPNVFMQTNSSPTAGTGLNLADYYQWVPGSEAPADAFTPPPSCIKHTGSMTKGCYNCHMPVNSTFYPPEKK